MDILGGKVRIIEGDVRCSMIFVNGLFCTLSKYKFKSNSNDQSWELMPPTNFSYAATWNVTLNVSKHNLLKGFDGITGTFDGSTKIVWLDYQNNSEGIKERTWTKQGR